MHENYIGNELELFDKAVNWKSYYGGFLKPYLKGTVMEVGAGIGATTSFLINENVEKWICVEPDERLAAEIREKINAGTLVRCELRKGTLKDQPFDEKYDAIIYIDVIEHIENDKGELELAFTHLKEGGHLIILVPAHNFLFSPFDKAIGHYRRYNISMLKEIIPAALQRKRLHYLDSLGLAASFANKLFLRQSYPSLKQVLFWDKKIIPLSKKIDSIIRFTAGKSVMGIWQKK